MQKVREHRVGIMIADREFSIFWQRRGPDSGRPRWPLLPWALPLIAATGIAVAMPIPRTTSGVQLTMPLDEALPNAMPTVRAPVPPRTSLKLVSTPVRKTSEASSAPVLDVGLDMMPQRAALAAALRSGEPTDWADASTGQSGVVVPGVADARNCRDVVVMTRRNDGNNENVSSTHCG